jgi:hypothetical protein
MSFHTHEETSMNIKKRALSAAILTIITAAGAARARGPVDPQTTNGWFANRIVGTFQTTGGKVGPCGTTPMQPVGNTISFNGGGTAIESPRFPPAGVPNVFGIPGVFTRNVGLGSWSYNPRTNRYSLHLQYDFFENGAFYGTGTVDRDLQLSLDGKTVSGSVQSTIYAADGSVIVALCGTATSTRL